MRFSYSQPYFIPFPGFFLRAKACDTFVLLDRVQFPRGFTWLRRNRLKGKDGVLWLTVPIKRKGMGLAPIDQVKIFYGENWMRKHLLSIRHSYLHSPYFELIYPKLEEVYNKKPERLLEFNLLLIQLIREELGTENNFVLQSEIGATGKREGLILNIAEKLGAEEVLLPAQARSHLKLEELKKNGLKPVIFNYKPAVYPQLWGKFIKDLSTLDILFNLGPAALPHLLRFQASDKVLSGGGRD